jgi:hypothetical protein
MTGPKIIAEAVVTRPKTDEGRRVCGYADIRRITEANSHTLSFHVNRK